MNYDWIYHLVNHAHLPIFLRLVLLHIVTWLWVNIHDGEEGYPATLKPTTQCFSLVNRVILTVPNWSEHLTLKESDGF